LQRERRVGSGGAREWEVRETQEHRYKSTDRSVCATGCAGWSGLDDLVADGVVD